MTINGDTFRFHELHIPARVKERARHLIPGGCHTYAKGDDQYPVLAPGFIARGLGCRVWDTNGREFIEYGMGNRAVGLGHAYPPVLQAVQRELPRGGNFTRPSPIEVACAEQFLSLIDGAEMVKFCKDGSDATSAAVRLARAYTGRDLIACCADHPFFSTDDWFIGTTPMNAGVPEVVRRLTLTFRYNDLAGAEALFARHPGQIAALILEPARTEEPQAGYLDALQRLCHAHGALLILDEMITGFRWHNGGAQKLYGIVPDLATFGKALANGFSVSALAGRREFMRLGGLEHDDRPRVFLLSTTHGAETHALAAAIATMQVYQREGVIDHLYRQGTRLKARAEEVIRRHGLAQSVKILGRPCCLSYATLDQDGRPSQAFRTLFLQETIRRGVLLPSLVVSYSHRDEDIDLTVAAIDGALAVYRRALDEGVERYLIGRPSQTVYRRHNRPDEPPKSQAASPDGMTAAMRQQISEKGSIRDRTHRSKVAASRRTLMLALPLLVGALVIGSDAVAARTAAIESDTALAPAPSSADRAADSRVADIAVVAQTAPAFPLVAKAGRRYLEDADGVPFLIHGDTAWSLIAQLTREDVDRYLDDRRARGFNTIMVELIEHDHATDPPANAYGELPFHGQPFEALAGLASLLPFRGIPKFRKLPQYGTSLATRFADYSAPNEAYFAHADWVLRRAAEKGFLVLLTPSFLGYDGSSWYRAMVANGPDRLRQYGEYLGRRYRDFSNILWVHAGDFNPPRKDLVRAIAEGIRKFDSRSLHTAHGAPDTAAIEYWEDEAWLQINNVYTYGPVYAPALEQYARPERMPFFMIESAYENEHETTERRLRTQAYQAVLSGAAGQVFGNNPIWHFDGPGIYPAPVTWQEALDGGGTQSMTHLRDLLMSMPWWLLEPDAENTFLTAGFGPMDDRAVAARAADGSFAILYLPSSRDITVDLARLAGPDVAARWYDPAAGRFSAVAGSPFPATAPRQFSPAPGDNSSGFDDWVLVLESPA